MRDFVNRETTNGIRPEFGSPIASMIQKQTGTVPRSRSAINSAGCTHNVAMEMAVSLISRKMRTETEGFLPSLFDALDERIAISLPPD